MQFTGMTLWSFAAASAAVVVLLGLLHYLRIRPNRHRVVTTLFWQQAAEEAKARTLFERFRHPRTYFLLLVIAMLLLLALARPVFRFGDSPYRVILLEAGLGMTTTDDRFERALDLVRSEAGSTDEDRVAVIAASPFPHMIKHFDESRAIMECRLSELRPSAELVNRAEALTVAGSYLQENDTGEVVVIAAQPPKETDPDIRVLSAGDVFPNAFVLSANFVPHPSDPTRGEFRFLVGYSGRSRGNVTVQADRQQESVVKERAMFDPGTIKEFKGEVVADGSLMTVKLSGDDAVASDSALEFTLPNRQRILVSPKALDDIPKVLRPVVDTLAEASTSIEQPAGLPLVRIGPAGSGAEIEIQASEGGNWGPVVATEHALVSGLTFEDAVCRVPLEPLSLKDGSKPLLLSNGLPIAVISADSKKITVSDVVLDSEASLVRRTGYLVFWSRIIHHLAGWDSGTVALPPSSIRATDEGITGSVVLKSDMSNFNLAVQPDATATVESNYSGLAVWQVLLGLAIALMAVEAVLNIRGRIA